MASGRLKDLAVLGGPPAFASQLHVGQPNIGDRGRLIERINDMLDRRWLTNNGPYVQELEARLAALLDVPHCVAVCNATVGLDLAGRALGLSGEVIVPAFTFIATAHAMAWQGLSPVFCDVDPRTHLIDPARAEALITPRTSAIVGVHTWGRPCAVEALSDLARRHRLRLIFDSAHALGCSHKGRMIGSFGDIEVFSFHATKFFNSFEGGALTTSDGDLAARLRLMRNFGFAGYDQVVMLGTNGKMCEAAAAMGLTSLEGLEEFIAAGRRNYHVYLRELDGIPGITLQRYDEEERCNYQYIVLEIDEERAGLHRDLLQRVVHAENVFARRYFFPGCHLMEPYRTTHRHLAGALPHTERLCERVLCLPTGTAVSAQAVAEICRIIRLAAGHAGELKRALLSAGKE